MTDDWVKREFSGEIRRTKTRTVPSEDHHLMRHNYVGMRGHVSLQNLLDYVAEHCPGIPYTDIALNWMTIQWEDAATPEEIAEWEAHVRKRKENAERWERETLARLKEKYG